MCIMCEIKPDVLINIKNVVTVKKFTDDFNEKKFGLTFCYVNNIKEKFYFNTEPLRDSYYYKMLYRESI